MHSSLIHYTCRRNVFTCLVLCGCVRFTFVRQFCEKKVIDKNIYHTVVKTQTLACRLNCRPAVAYVRFHDAFTIADRHIYFCPAEASARPSARAHAHTSSGAWVDDAAVQ